MAAGTKALPPPLRVPLGRAPLGKVPLCRVPLFSAVTSSPGVGTGWNSRARLLLLRSKYLREPRKEKQRKREREKERKREREKQ